MLQCPVVHTNTVYVPDPLYVGKTLVDESQTLSALGMKQGSKLILLGRQARNYCLLIIADH